MKQKMCNIVSFSFKINFIMYFRKYDICNSGYLHFHVHECWVIVLKLSKIPGKMSFKYLLFKAVNQKFVYTNNSVLRTTVIVF